MKTGRYQHTPESKRHTVAEAIDRYLVDVLPRKPKNAANVRIHLRWWREALGHCVLANLSPPMLIEKLGLLGREAGAKGKQRGASTIVRYSSSFSHVLSVASREWMWMQDNPLQKVRKPSEPRGRVRYLDEVERAKLMQACRESSTPLLYPAVVMAISTGLRKAELMSLTWRDVDLEKGYLILNETKNGERRGVPIRGLALDLLRKLFDQKATSLFVFPGRNSKFPADLRGCWETAVEAAGITDFRWHDLRHCCASYLIAGGASLAEIA
jgi:integrase